MTAHTPAIAVSHDQPVLPNQHFSSWLRGQTTLFIGQIVAILGSISLIASTIYYVSHIGHNESLTLLTVKLIVDCAHLAFIAVFILVMIRFLDDNERGSYRVRLVYDRVFKKPKKKEGKIEDVLEDSKAQLGTFKRRFLWFWVGMLCLYVSFACQHAYEASLKQVTEPAGKAVSLSFAGRSQGKEEAFNGELSMSITDEAQAAASENSASETRKASPEEVHMKLVFSFLTFFFNNFTLLFVFSCFLVLYIKPDEKEKEWKYLVGSVVIVASLTILFLFFLVLKKDEFTDESATAYLSIFDALSGVINAVVLALLIARLDSKLVGLPSWLISILYSYAAVQPLFLVFELRDSHLLQRITVLVLIFVFISKIYFFLIIFYALQTGKMLNYLTCFPILHKRVPKHQESAAEGASRLKQPGMSKRLGLIMSGLLRSRHSQTVSEVIGWVAISYFFISMIGPQTVMKARGEGGVQSAAIFIPGLPLVAVHIAQLIVVALIIVILFLVSDDNGFGHSLAGATVRNIFNETVEHGDAMKDGEAQLKKFKRYFLYFWCVTFLLYVVLLFEPPGYGPSEERTFKHMVEVLRFPALEFLLASLNLMCAFWCFVVLQSPAFIEPAAVKHKRSDMMRKHFAARQKRFEARQKLLINYSSFVVLLLIAVYPLLLGIIKGPVRPEGNLRDYATVFDGVTGMLSAVVLALLIARMDSKLFNLPSRLIWMLFAYASIQPLFIAFPQVTPVLQMVKTSVLTAALGLKICLFLIVAHSLQSGKMLTYLVCFPLLKERVDSIFENQFEIRLARGEDKEFTFSILKKNQLHYSTARTFESREECDKAVEELRGLMGVSDSYGSPRQSSGTYWVEVRSDTGLLCESVPLRSEEEALDLIDESISKVPYCKYNRL